MITFTHYCQPEFRVRIVQRLQERGLSKIQLADQCGVSRTKLYEWLAGRLQLPELQVNAVCDLLDICE